MRLAEFDNRGLQLAAAHCHQPALERAVAGYSRLGEHGACWLALGAGGAAFDRDRDRRRAWCRGVGVVASAYALNYAVKLIVRRPRPELAALTPVVSRLSFPSAHATTSFAAARAFRGLAPGWAMYAAAVAFGLSRPYLGVHYPSDVLAGALFGTVIAAVAT